MLNCFASHHSFKSKVTRYFFCRYPEFQWYLMQSNLDFPNLLSWFFYYQDLHPWSYFWWLFISHIWDMYQLLSIKQSKCNETPIKTEFALLSVEHCLLTSKLLQIFFPNINNKRHWFDRTISKFIQFYFWFITIHVFYSPNS